METQIATPQEVRFTQNDEAFYAIFLDEPVVSDDGFVWVNATVPIVEGDTVSLLGLNATDGANDLVWETSEEGYLAVSVTADVIAQGSYAWVFKVAYA